MKCTRQYLSNGVSIDAKTDLYQKLLTSLNLPKKIFIAEYFINKACFMPEKIFILTYF